MCCTHIGCNRNLAGIFARRPTQDGHVKGSMKCFRDFEAIDHSKSAYATLVGDQLYDATSEYLRHFISAVAAVELRGHLPRNDRFQKV
jgi:hypothetical protein